MFYIPVVIPLLYHLSILVFPFFLFDLSLLFYFPNSREVFKLGVVYVRRGQEEQNEILRNENGSELYNEFLKGLGWLVDLKNHNGFLGGLDRNYMKQSLFYSGATNEVMFHAVTLMPNREDEQQIEKVSYRILS